MHKTNLHESDVACLRIWCGPDEGNISQLHGSPLVDDRGEWEVETGAVFEEIREISKLADKSDPASQHVVPRNHTGLNH